MDSVLTPDVLVIGAGIAGSAVAVGLKKKNLNVLLIEKNEKPMRLFKGEYLQPAASDYLRQLGFEDIFNSPTTDFISELRFRDLDEKNNVISDLLMKYPKGATATSITHFDLLDALRSHAKAVLGQQFLTGVKIEPLNLDDADFNEHPQFKIENIEGSYTVKPRWVIGCDGRTSTVRRWIKGPSAPQNSAVVWGAGPELIIGAETHTPAPKSNRYEVIRTYQEGTLSAFSLGQLGQRYYYSSPELRGNLNNLLFDKLSGIVEKVSTHAKLGPLSKEAGILGFPSYTESFLKETPGAFLLAGDSACVTTPYGGQGMTSAVENAKFLIENFDFRTEINLLKQFNKKRYFSANKATYARISLLNFGLYYLFFSRSPFFKKVSSHVISHWNQNTECQTRVMELFSGYETTKPGALELAELWGINQLKEFPQLVPKMTKELLITLNK